jgi:hypothetical protein
MEKYCRRSFLSRGGVNSDPVTTALGSVEAGRRRSDRFAVLVPVEVRWEQQDGLRFQENAHAREVSGNGGLLEMRNYPVVGTRVELKNLLSSETTQAKVVATRRSRDGAALGVAVELSAPSETFWGVTFRLKKTSAELLKLEKSIKQGGIDPRVLSEFRDAVDYVRKTAWAVQEWQERQLRQRDTATVLPLLTAERIRRAAQLSEVVASDLDTHQVTYETTGIDKLFGAVGRLHERLTCLFGRREKH